MAAATISTEDIKENILKCDNCNFQFDSNDRVPRMLPCQHSFCSRCLDNEWKRGSKLSCPSCRQHWDVRNSVEETFPVELTAMKFVVLVELKSRRGRHLCTDCSDRSPATHHCLNCQLYICEEGVRAHKRFFKQKNHKVISIAEILKLPENYFNETESCEIHPGSTIDLYCEKPSCMMPVCPSCAMIQHKERDGHEIRDLKDVIEDEKRAIFDLLERLKKKQYQIVDEKSDVGTELMFLNTESKRLESSIERYFNDFVDQANEQKNELRSSLHLAIDDERDQVQRCLESLNEMSVSEERYASYCNELLKTNKPIRILKEKEAMKDKLTELINVQFPDKPDRREVFIDLTSLNDVMNKMAKVGEVIYLDHTALEWRYVLEITDGIHREECTIIKAFLTYTGNDAIPPKTPCMKAIIEDSSGLFIQKSLKSPNDGASTHSDELDSPSTSRRFEADVHNGTADLSNPDLNRKKTLKTDSQRSVGIEPPADHLSVGQQKRHNRGTYRLDTPPLKDLPKDENRSNVFEKTDFDKVTKTGERPRSGATNRTGKLEDPMESASELQFSPRVLGPHKVGFKIGGHPVNEENFIFESRASADDGLDRCLHFLTWREDQAAVKSLNLPHIGLSEERLNREQCTITESGKLIKCPSAGSDRTEPSGFTNYCGTTGKRCFSGSGAYYWHVTCHVRVLTKVTTFGKMILEAAVAHGDVLDNSYCVWEKPRAWSLVISICSTHKAVCIKVVYNSKVMYDAPIMQCEEQAVSDIEYGVLVDLNRRRVTFIDVKNLSVMWSFGDIDTTKSLWPVFGVYNRYHFGVELGVTSGDRLTVDLEDFRFLEDML